MRLPLLVAYWGLALLLSGRIVESGCPFAKQSSLPGVSHHRHLLQANCALQFNGQPQPFKACQDLSSIIGAPYNLLWSLTDEGNGSSIMSGALDVQSTGWAAFGLPETPGSGMLGGSAVIVKANTSAPSGASVDNYYLGGYSSTLVQPPGKLDLLSASAAMSGNRLQALFQIRLPTNGSTLSATPTDYLMALGRLDPSGNLVKHANSQGIENTVDLGAGLPGAAAAPAGALASAQGAAAAPPAVAAPPDVLVLPAAGQAEGMPAMAAAPAAAAPVGAEGPTASTGCTLQVNNKIEAFAQCKALTTGLRLLWSLWPDQQGGGSLMKAALQCANPNGWCGWGLPTSPGKMIGASAVIVKACPSCPTGASADNYLLAAKSTSGVQPGTGKLDIQGPMMATTTRDGGMAVLFTLHVPQNMDLLDSVTDCIAAHGALGEGGLLLAHADTDSVAGTLNLASGAVLVADSPAIEKYEKAHGVLMSVAWTIILPISIVIATTMRTTLKPGIWFQIHRALGVLALSCILAGFGLGVYLWTKVAPIDRTLCAHVSIGIITTAFALLQAQALVACPKQDTKLRRLWNHYHHNVGRLAVLAAFANAIIGFHIGDLDWGWYLGMCLIWVLIWVLGGAKAFYDRRRMQQRELLKDSADRSGASETATELTGQSQSGKFALL
ncbi:probable cytochrome b561 and DOMON domain-containing protein At3g61 at C-terminar half [Coccomyxa sp. Obi]|nr:probable cytochrome b561 and DOMON domain-containing protein At3g61 at C-terminar half [Coccomyxa sp. Obi]